MFMASVFSVVLAVCVQRYAYAWTVHLKCLCLCVCLRTQGGRHSRSPSMVSLTVETALGSFDFLNTSDWEEEEEDKGDSRNRNARSVVKPKHKQTYMTQTIITSAWKHTLMSSK